MLGTSIGMFLLDGLAVTHGLDGPAKAFLVLAAYGLFGISIDQVVRILAAVLGGVSGALQQATSPEPDDDG